MRVLVTFALDAEFAPWRKLRKFLSVDYDGLQLFRSKAGETDLTILLTGVGKESSAKAMGLMMTMADDDKYFDVCISSGLAGALCETLAVGDIIAPQSLIAESQHADVAIDELKVDEELHERALAVGAIRADCLFTTDRMFVKASQKSACASQAQLVDMESFEIVKEAVAWGARSVVVRAVSDTAKEDLPIDFSLTLSAKQQISIAKVLWQLLKNPLALPALMRFGRQSRYAAGRLVKYLDGYVQAIGNVSREVRSREVAAR